MNRQQLEHVIRAAGAIAEVDELIIIGSQAILASQTEIPEKLLVSREVDLYPAKEPEKAILIDGCIGEGSLFDEQFKYYAHGVGPETATLPEGWRHRLVPIQNEYTRNVRALCLHPVDIAASKLVAGRDKDLAYVKTMMDFGVANAQEVADAVAELPDEKRELAKSRLSRLADY
jgi:hypothetical protein